MTAARNAADLIAERLASPDDARRLVLKNGWVPQSLAYGAVGVALLHIERALTGDGPWQRAHDWLSCATHQPLVGIDASHLFFGVPALAFALDAAGPGRYTRALDALDHRIGGIVRERVQRAHARMDRSELPALAEFDAIRGLTGLGSLLLRRDVHAVSARAVLDCLVRLTEPVTVHGEALPGWWSLLAPSGKSSPDFPGGHANSGIAHGIGAVLALLGSAARRGITVDGQDAAIARIFAWLDEWRQDGPTGPWWPYWVTRGQLRTGKIGNGPSRPSWCYGTAGLARAQQIAALAAGDTARQLAAEAALAQAMTDPGQLQQTADLSLCHGYAGLAHITRLAANDAGTSNLAGCLPRLLAPMTDISPEALFRQLLHPSDRPGDIGFLDGAAGVALAMHSVAAATPPISGWDACLLIT
ncbi:lanthionine synthetase C family protein [Yinghuangia soli]|uniref:Lanthionine synthetase C family protein n=1 Tax=Yinghuangia soli TaxID=2908204 RepID=A0AA41Q422_9ACTN|nr:lanthionine synthetase C family protein [Yinghuangia soli]MCF2531153.1 lanthionine synthetase C family protein [Yinghuangia soli]